jgi:hypothetical protein
MKTKIIIFMAVMLCVLSIATVTYFNPIITDRLSFLLHSTPITKPSSDRIFVFFDSTDHHLKAMFPDSSFRYLDSSGTGGTTDSTKFATIYYVNAQGFLKSVDSAKYATKYYVNSQGFLKTVDSTIFGTIYYINNQGFLKSVDSSIFATKYYVSTQSGIKSINTLTANAITFAYDYNASAVQWQASGSTVTLYIPNAGAGKTSGLVTNTTQEIDGDKTMNGVTSFLGSVDYNTSASSANSYTLDNTNHYLYLIPTNHNVRVLLPNISTANTGREYIIINYEIAGNDTVWVIPYGASQKINGLDSISILDKYSFVRLHNNGSAYGWVIVGK